MAEVSLKNVRKVYGAGDVPAVADLNIEIADGEFVVLVGPSGCGKSTTLRMVAGLEEVSGGTIAIDGRVVNDVLPKDRDIAMVFQNYALYPHMRVFDNMAFGLKLRRVPRAEISARVHAAADILGIRELLDRRPKELSGGQRQRVAVGRAIVRQPKLFLFDEPLSNLDAKLRAQMRTELKLLHRRLGATMLYVTHDQTEAMTMGDRIVVMEAGHVRQVADPITLYSRPANRFVAGFIGTPPMNFFEGRVQERAGGWHFVAEGCDLSLPAAWAAAAAGLVGAPVTLGIRPEEIGLAPVAGAAESQAQVTATIDVVEPTGAETFLYCRVGAQRFVARVGGWQPLSAGAQVVLHLQLTRACLFDANGQAI